MVETFLTALVFAGIVGHRIYALVRESPHYLAKKRLRRAPHHSIEAFPDGVEGCIAGRVIGEGVSLKAPLTGRDCVAYQVRVEGGGARHRGWKVVAEASSTTPFVIADETGKALVRARRYELVLNVDHEDMSDALCPANSRAEAFLAERKQSSQGRALRYQEAILRLGDRVVVLGLGRHEPEPDTGSRKAVGYRDSGRRLVIGDLGDEPVLVAYANP